MSASTPRVYITQQHGGVLFLIFLLSFILIQGLCFIQNVIVETTVESKVWLINITQAAN